MLLTRREAIAGCCGGLALLRGPSALAEASYPNQTDAGQFCRFRQDRGRSLGGHRPRVGRRAGM